MRLKLTSAYVFTFLMLAFFLGEMHEIVHTSVGRWICGCWGKRDFNAWELCETCETNPYGFIATMVGPIFTFAMAYWGASMLNKTHSVEKNTLGFSLIFASTSLPRLLNVWPFGGGDEFTILYDQVFNQQRTISLVVAFVLIAVIVFYPLRKAYFFIENKHRFWWFLSFSLAPFVATLFMILGVWNSVLATGFMGGYWILGSPKIVTLWTAFVTAMFFMTKKNLYQLAN
ncbi:MAG: hypothetical protein ACRCVT_05825 [Leadbetterella sp.]